VAVCRCSSLLLMLLPCCSLAPYRFEVLASIVLSGSVVTRITLLTLINKPSTRKYNNGKVKKVYNCVYNCMVLKSNPSLRIRPNSLRQSLNYISNLSRAGLSTTVTRRSTGGMVLAAASRVAPMWFQERA
jgi:hypothetical protein